MYFNRIIIECLNDVHAFILARFNEDIYVSVPQWL